MRRTKAPSVRWRVQLGRVAMGSPSKVTSASSSVGTITITATDAEVSLTLFFNRGSCVIFDGIVGRPAMHIEAESEAILGLTSFF